MKTMIAYKDCKTPADYRKYEANVQAIREAMKAAHAAADAILAIGAITDPSVRELLDKAVAVTEALHAKLHEYTADEAAEGIWVI